MLQWNRFGCNIDEQLIKETGDALVALGLRDAGYNYLNIDGECTCMQPRAYAIAARICWSCLVAVFV